MSHYYLNDQSLDHNIKTYDVTIKKTTLRLHTDLGVFSKDALDYGTRFLLETIEINDQIQTIIDMGCGYGPIGLYMAKTYPNTIVYMRDVNLRAVELALKNQAENKIKNVNISAGFLFEDLKVEADMILSNPPIRAGKQTIFKLYEDAHTSLKQGGLLAVVIQKKQGAPSTFDKLTSLFTTCKVLDKSKGYWVIQAQK